MDVAVTLLPVCLSVCLPVFRPWALMTWSAKAMARCKVHKVQRCKGVCPR
jgi:hypothetical protein